MAAQGTSYEDRRESMNYICRFQNILNFVQLWDNRLTLRLLPHLHLIEEVKEHGPQLSSWQSFSHKWTESTADQTSEREMEECWTWAVTNNLI